MNKGLICAFKNQLAPKTAHQMAFTLLWTCLHGKNKPLVRQTTIFLISAGRFALRLYSSPALTIRSILRKLAMFVQFWPVSYGFGL